LFFIVCKIKTLVHINQKKTKKKFKKVISKKGSISKKHTGFQDLKYCMNPYSPMLHGISGKLKKTNLKITVRFLTPGIGPLKF
jgi:hypothetical protein